MRKDVRVAFGDPRLVPQGYLTQSCWEGDASATRLAAAFCIRKRQAM